MQQLGVLETICRYPVKSMAGEQVDEAFIGYSGLMGDRVCAFVRGDGTKGFPWHTGREQEDMILFRPRFRQPEAVTLPADVEASFGLAPGVTKTEAIRRTIRHSRKSLSEWARHCGINQKTTATCKKQGPVVSLTLVAILVMSNIHGTASETTGSATEPIRQFYDVLLSNMQNGPSLGPKGRYERLEPVIGQSFDLLYMTRVAVGPAWSGISEIERQQVTNAFGRYTAATYATRFDSYSGQKLQVTGEQPRASGVIVDSRIVRTDGSAVTIRYLMRRDGDVWRVADIYLSGTISEVAVHRSEFSSIIDRQGVRGLIVMLNRKADMLVANVSGK